MGLGLGVQTAAHVGDEAAVLMCVMRVMMLMLTMITAGMTTVTLTRDPDPCTRPLITEGMTTVLVPACTRP